MGGHLVSSFTHVSKINCHLCFFFFFNENPVETNSWDKMSAESTVEAVINKEMSLLKA